MAAAPTGVDDGQGDSQGQTQAPPPEASGLHMLAKTVLPPSVYTRAVSGNFSGVANGAAACSRSGGDDSGAAIAANGPTEVVLATATSLLLISVAAPMPEAELTAAAAVGAASARALADAMVDHDMAPAAGDSEDGDEADDRSAAHQVLCEQTAFGAVVAIAAFRHPHPAESQDPAQDLLLLLLAHSPQLLALRFDREFARFLPVTRIDCGLGSSLKGYPAKLAVAPGGSAIAVASRRGDPVVLLPGPDGGFLPPMAVPLAAANAARDAPPNAAAVAELRAAVDLAEAAPKPADVLSICFADGTLPVALVLARSGGSSLSLWQCWPSAGCMQCALIMELVVVTSWPGSHMRSIPPQVFPTTPFAIDSVPGHPTGVLLLTPLEARVVSWGAVAAGDPSSSQAASSLQVLARWRLDGGDPADIGFAAARQMQRDGMSRDLCAAWAWDKADAATTHAAAQPSGGAAGGASGSDIRQGCSVGSQWMVVDVTGGRLPEDALQGTCSGVDAWTWTGATETTEHGMPGQPEAAGAAHEMAATPQQQQRLTHRLLVASSGNWIQRFSGSGCDGPVAPVEGRTWWLLALQGGQLLASSRDGGADLLQCSVSTDGAAADRQQILPGGGAASGGMVVADLAGLGQPQAYTVCRGLDEGSGSLHVIYPRPVPETVFESGADYGGVTGIWAVAARPADAAHALVVLSFVSGSRALSIADGELSDATEAVALAADECTIAAGCIGDLLAAQVTASRIQLCGLASMTGGGATASGSGGGSQEATAEGDAPDSPRPSLGKRHASWATMEGIADTFASRLVPFSDDVSSAPLPSPSRRRSEHQSLLGSASGGHSGGSGSGSFSGAGSGFVAELFGSSGESSSRGPEDVWRPAGGVAISVAAVAPGFVFYSCAGGKVLHAVALRRRAVDGGEGSGSGKRKRCSGDGWRLAPIASAPVAAELSCIDCMPAPGVQGGLLIAVGTHEPAVELLLLRPAASPALPTSLVPLGCLDLVPPPPPLVSAIVHPRQQRRRALLAAALGLDTEEGGSSSAAGMAAQQRGSIPESVQLLPSAGVGTSCEMLVGLRSGALLRAVAQSAAGAAGGNSSGGGGGGEEEDMADAEVELPGAEPQADAAGESWDMKQVGHAQQLGSLPAGLVPLPASGGDAASALALVLSERPFVVRRQPGAAFHCGSTNSASNGSGVSDVADGSGMHSSGSSNVCGGGGGSSGNGTRCGSSLLAEGLPSAEALCALRLTQATALTLPGEEPRTLVLGAGGDGRLRLLDIGSAVRTRQLRLSPARSSAAATAQPHDGFQPAAAEAITGQALHTSVAPAPTLLAAAPLQGLLIVACSPAEGSVAPSIVAVQPATGEVVAQCELACDEEVTALAAWPTNTAPFAQSTTTISSSAAPLPGSQAGSGQAGSAAAAAAAAAAVLAAQTDPAPASGLTRFSAQHFQPADELFPPAQTAGSAPISSFRGEAGSNTDFVAVGTSCIQPPPAPWYVPAGRRGRLLLLRLQPPGRDGSRQGWRLVAEEVLQLAEPVTQLAPAGVPGFLLAGVGSGLAAYRLVRRRVWADRHAVGSVDGTSTRIGHADDDDDDVSSHAAGHVPVPRHWRVSEEAAARRQGRQPHPPPPPPPPAAPPQRQQQERRQQQQQEPPQRPLRPAAAAAAIAAAVPAGDREAGWGFEARRRAVRKLPGGSGSFDGVLDGGAPAAAASAGGSTTTEEIPPQRWLEHWGLARHAWKRLPAPVASLHVDAMTSAIAVADTRNPVRLLGFDPLGDPPFAVLRLDRAARSVLAAAALPPQPPDQAAPAPPRCVDCGCVVSPPEAACAVACDAIGGIAVLSPDTAHRGPEASINAAACYNLGCPAACVVPGSLGFEGLTAQDLPLGRATSASGMGSAAAGAPRAAGADAPPATAVSAEVASPAFLVASLDGALTAAAPLSRDLHALLAALEAAMDAAQLPAASPISGACRATLRECSSVVRAAAAASASSPPTRMVDGDLLHHFLRLPEPQQQTLVARALDTLERSQNPAAALPPGSIAAALALPELGGGGQSAGTLEADTRLVASHVEAMLAAMQ